MKNFTSSALIIIIILVFAVFPSTAQIPALETPLSQETLDMLTNEISGQVIFNNMVLLAGAPWIRDRSELTDTFYESQKIYDLVRSYGIETSQFVRHASDSRFDYPFWGELRIIDPEERSVARLDADPALIARSSQNVDITADLIYIPPLSNDEANAMISAGVQEKYRGKVALMWSHANGLTARALNAAGLAGVISFNSRERYFDPNQVVYSRGSYGGENLRFGFSISWRQWSELFEDIEYGKKMTVRCVTEIENFQDRFETVFSWIPGTEPDEKGVIFTAHLFEGYTKRGANDNMGGCVIQLEILRVLSKLINEGKIERPRRNIYFLWPNEISGTYKYIEQNPGFADKLSMNINMDMVSEGLRINNSHFTMSECPGHLPNYLDGLAASVLNYVWRTNDIVYLPDSPRGRRGGQYFPKPMWEKNGSIDAFRFYIHKATGGSDHICFNDPSVAVPGIEFFTWPDYWYHADTDTPDKGDPTEMKRVAFIGAACAWAAANCTEEVLDGLLNAVSELGYGRIAERDHPAALRLIESADKENIGAKTALALTIIEHGTARESGAVASVREIAPESGEAMISINNRLKQWDLYKENLSDQVLEYARLRADQLKARRPSNLKMTSAEKRLDKRIPAYTAEIMGKQFRLIRSQNMRDYMNTNYDSMITRGLDYSTITQIMNYINGQRSVTGIKRSVSAETYKEIPVSTIAEFIDLLVSFGWVMYN